MLPTGQKKKKKKKVTLYMQAYHTHRCYNVCTVMHGTYICILSGGSRGVLMVPWNPPFVTTTIAVLQADSLYHY